MLVKDGLQFIIWWLRLLLNDVSKVKWVFPEDEDEDDFEDESDISDQADKPAQLVLVATILFVFLGRAPINQEKLDEVIDPADCNQKNEAAEGLSSESRRVV